MEDNAVLEAKLKKVALPTTEFSTFENDNGDSMFLKIHIPFLGCLLNLIRNRPFNLKGVGWLWSIINFDEKNILKTLNA